MNICIRLTLDTTDPAEADRIVSEMMAKPHKGVLAWGKHKNGECRLEGQMKSKCIVFLFLLIIVFTQSTLLQGVSVELPAKMPPEPTGNF